MVGAVRRACAVRILESLLDGRDILLSGRQVPGLEIGDELVEGLCGRVDGCAGRAAAGTARTVLPEVVAGCENAACNVAKSDCAAERLPDVRSLLSCCICCW